MLEIKDGKFLLNGKEFRIYSGCIHYFRVPEALWRDRLAKLKAAGLNTVETYVAWNMHEAKRGEYVFSGMADIVKFIKTAQELGLYVILRPGPYICAEWDLGGLPAWILADKNVVLRCMNKPYLSYVEEWFKVLFDKVRDLQITRGGNIIAMQIENEYGSYGNDKEYLQYIADLMKKFGAEELEQLYFGRRTARSLQGAHFRFQRRGSLFCFERLAGRKHAQDLHGVLGRLVRPLGRKTSRSSAQAGGKRDQRLFGHGCEFQPLYVPRRHQLRLYRGREPFRRLSAHDHEL